MKLQVLILMLLSVNFVRAQIQPAHKTGNLFDGKTFNGWEGDTIKTWHIVDQAIVGGNLKQTVPHNQFLASLESFDNFELTMNFKLEGTGFVNAGVQFHSERATNPDFEMIGYQADLGEGYWASLYDESRRNVTIVKPDSLLINKILIRNNWNKFTIRSEGRRIRIWLNDVQTVDFIEPDEKITHKGHLALQVHGGGKTLVWYKDIKIIRL